MVGASGEIGIPAAAVAAIAGGCDLLCIGTKNTDEQLGEIEAALDAAVADGALLAGRLADAAARNRRLAEQLADPAPASALSDPRAVVRPRPRDRRLRRPAGRAARPGRRHPDPRDGGEHRDRPRPLGARSGGGRDDPAARGRRPAGLRRTHRHRRQGQPPPPLDARPDRSGAGAGPGCRRRRHGVAVVRPRLRRHRHVRSLPVRRAGPRAVSSKEHREYPGPSVAASRHRHRRHQDRRRRDRTTTGSRRARAAAARPASAPTRCSRPSMEAVRRARRTRRALDRGRLRVDRHRHPGRGRRRVGPGRARRQPRALEGLDLGSELEARLGRAVRVENDVNAAALGAFPCSAGPRRSRWPTSTSAPASPPDSCSAGACGAARAASPARSVTSRSTRPDRSARAVSAAASSSWHPDRPSRGSGRPTSRSPCARCSPPRMPGTPSRSRCATGCVDNVAAAVRMLVLTVDVDNVVIGGGLSLARRRAARRRARACSTRWAAGSAFLASLAAPRPRARSCRATSRPPRSAPRSSGVDAGAADRRGGLMAEVVHRPRSGGGR